MHNLIDKFDVDPLYWPIGWHLVRNTYIGSLYVCLFNRGFMIMMLIKKRVSIHWAVYKLQAFLCTVQSTYSSENVLVL